MVFQKNLWQIICMPFGSYEFKCFCNEWNIKLVTTSPRYPKSNGFAEKIVGICKQMLRKCKETNGDLNLMLLNYRCTPVCGWQYSPSQLMNSRLLRSTIPMHVNKLERKVVENVENMLKENQIKYKYHHDRHAKAAVGFKIGDSVLYKKSSDKRDQKWLPGVIKGVCNTPRSYIVINEYGRTYRRNSFLLKHNPNKCTQKYRFVNREALFNNDKGEGSLVSVEENNNSNETNVDLKGERGCRERRMPIRYKDFHMY